MVEKLKTVQIGIEEIEWKFSSCLCFPPVCIFEDKQFSWSSVSGICFKKYSVNLEANMYIWNKKYEINIYELYIWDKNKYVYMKNYVYISSFYKC